MAIRTISVAGGNYNSAATWDEGIVPTSADDVVARVGGDSGNLVINVNSVAKTVDFTNYSSTLSGSATWTISGSFKYIGTMIVSYIGTLTFNATATLTSNGQTHPGHLSFITTATQTYTFADNWTISGNFSNSANGSSFNGSTVFVGGDLTNTNAADNPMTASFVMNGTGTLLCTSNWGSSININTAGTITLGSVIRLSQQSGAARTLSYTAGTIINTGSTLRIVRRGWTVDTSGMTWNNVEMLQSDDPNTLILGSDINIAGNLLFNAVAGSELSVTGAKNFNIYGNCTISNTTRNIVGNCKLKFLGINPIFSNAMTTAWIALNIDIDIAGTITFNTGIKQIGIMTYINGIAAGRLVFNRKTTASVFGE